MRCVAIAGVGLLGGSFARALRARGFDGRILGVSSPPALRAALDLGIVDEGLPFELAIPQADLVLLARPILKIAADLARIDPFLKPGALVTDVGSTKLAICAAAQSIRRGIFLGGHPMAGKETAGVEHSDPALFQGSTWFLTPDPPSLLDSPPALDFLRLIESLGATPVPLAPAAHDRLVAFTSHLPQLMSTALAVLLDERLGSPTARAAAGNGLRDMTRLAGSDYAVWKDILATNSANVSDALDAFLRRLTLLRDEIQASPLESDSSQPAVSRDFKIAAEFAKPLRKIGR